MTEKIKWPKKYLKPRIYAVKMDPEQAVLSCCGFDNLKHNPRLHTFLID